MALNNAINSPALGGFTGSAANAVLLTNNASANGAIANSAAFTANGQLLIGNGSSAPTIATLTAGAGISVTNGSGSITIAATGSGGLTWQIAPNGSQAVTASQGWFVGGASNVFTLPAADTIGDTVSFAASTANAYTVTANTGDTIVYGSQESASAGTLVSNAAKGASVTLVSNGAGKWVATATFGSFTTT